MSYMLYSKQRALASYRSYRTPSNVTHVWVMFQNQGEPQKHSFALGPACTPSASGLSTHGCSAYLQAQQ